MGQKKKEEERRDEKRLLPSMLIALHTPSDMMSSVNSKRSMPL